MIKVIGKKAYGYKILFNELQILFENFGVKPQTDDSTKTYDSPLKKVIAKKLGSIFHENLQIIMKKVHNIKQQNEA